MRRNIKSKTKESRTPSNVAYLQRKAVYMALRKNRDTEI